MVKHHCREHSSDTGRAYRHRVRSPDLVTFQVSVKETDLLISAEMDLAREALYAIWKYRRQIESYIERNPGFRWSLTPYPVHAVAPRIVRDMAEAAEATGVGPMASVAGAIAQWVGRDLLLLSPQIVIENGGDIFLVTQKERILSIDTKSSDSFSSVSMVIRPEKTPLGICTSSGTEGHSLSFGHADAVTVIASSSILADAAATAAGNIVRSGRDIGKALTFLKGIPGICAAVVLADGAAGIWGDIELLDDNIQEGV